MSKLDPPLEVVDPKNKEHAQFVTDVVSKKAFCDYSQVSPNIHTLTHTHTHNGFSVARLPPLALSTSPDSPPYFSSFPLLSLPLPFSCPSLSPSLTSFPVSLTLMSLPLPFSCPSRSTSHVPPSHFLTSFPVLFLFLPLLSVSLPDPPSSLLSLSLSHPLSLQHSISPSLSLSL